MFSFCLAPGYTFIFLLLFELYIRIILFSEVKRYICPILIYNTSHICENTPLHATMRPMFSIFGLCTTSRFDEFRKRQEIMLLFTPVRQRKIITSRSILTIPIGIRMNFARGLSVMADGFTRICSSVMIPIKRV